MTRKLGFELSAQIQNNNFGFSPVEIILSAFSSALSVASGRNHVQFRLINNGRAKVFPGVDVAKTVGWFSMHSPVIIHVDRSGGLREQVSNLRTQLISIPMFGMGFNAFQYLSDNAKTREYFSSLATPDFDINYLASDNVSEIQKDLFESTGGLVTKAKESSGKTKKDQLYDVICPAYIHINFIDGQYTILCMARDNVFKKETLERILKVWLSDIDHIVRTLSAS